MKMISRFPKSFSRILSSVVNRQHSNSALQLISSRPGVSTIVAVSAVGCGVAAYSVLGKQQVPAIKRKPVWTTSGINSSENVLDVIGGSNVKILSSMQPRVVDNVTQDAARKIRKRAIFQEKEHIMLPINGDDGEFGEEFNHNVQYGINSVDMTIRSCINGFEAFNEESYLVRGICAEMYKAVREKELAKDVTDTASRKGQWLCVRILDQDIECEYDKNGNKENQIINGFEIGYYPSLDSVLEDGVTTVDDMHYYFNCLGFEKNDAPAQNSLKESETQGSLFHRIIGSYISDYRKPPYYKNQQIIDTVKFFVKFLVCFVSEISGIFCHFSTMFLCIVMFYFLVF